MEAQAQTNGNPSPLAARELGTDDSGFRRRIASASATESYFAALRRTIDHAETLHEKGVLRSEDLSRVHSMVQNTFRQDHPLLEVDDEVPTLEDFCLNVNDQILAEKMDFIDQARKRAEGRQRKWMEEAS